MQWLTDLLITGIILLLSLLAIIGLGVLVYQINERKINTRIRQKLRDMDCIMLSVEDVTNPDIPEVHKPSFIYSPRLYSQNAFRALYKRITFQDIHRNNYNGVVIIKKIFLFTISVDFYFP